MTLQELLVLVEKAEGPDRELDLALATALLPDVVVLRRNRADTANEPFTYWEYSAKIDDALALVERLLPGRWRLILNDALNSLWAVTASGLPRLPLFIVWSLLQALIQEQKDETK